MWYTNLCFNSSIDAWINPLIRNKPVPNWNYILVKFQIFLLYFYAGIKKMDPEWLGGYSMKNLGTHRVFTPFKYVYLVKLYDLNIYSVSPRYMYNQSR